ncbi:hypothetical protein SLEP1_g52591 [Rubroshorea leprosula]|uniref:Germin-like protein n=1 Tax=Rubroshorea leprosula TaxID=152421 RepID=A0AAV5M6S3_9ROSI|nr:hypothetical protein SLEP1_g52591 [Rubroshorea leprosula]
MNSTLFFCIMFCTCISIGLADPGNLQDTCPTGPQTMFINGLLCKNPVNISASDFKSTKLRDAGNTKNSLGSAVSIATDIDFPGLNTLGLSTARTDLEVAGLVTPHSHPRATEMFFLYNGSVMAGFIDTNNKVFRTLMKAGDVIVFPRGLFHFCYNVGSEFATAYSVLNSQNPGVTENADAISISDSGIMNKIKNRLISSPESKVKDTNDATLSGFSGLHFA